jgi:hypothetical protein
VHCLIFYPTVEIKNSSTQVTIYAYCEVVQFNTFICVTSQMFYPLKPSILKTVQAQKAIFAIRIAEFLDLFPLSNIPENSVFQKTGSVSVLGWEAPTLLCLLGRPKLRSSK